MNRKIKDKTFHSVSFQLLFFAKVLFFVVAVTRPTNIQKPYNNIDSTIYSQIAQGVFQELLEM